MRRHNRGFGVGRPRRRGGGPERPRAVDALHIVRQRRVVLSQAGAFVHRVTLFTAATIANAMNRVATSAATSA
jgi:hypothetical protein